jgi:toxin-antitoxin system PIN domain toxin
VTVLLDANVLIAVVVTDHVHHDAAEAWFADLDDEFATCPMTQGALLRLVMRHGATADQGVRALTSVTGHDGHRFWPDDVGFASVRLTGVVGHRQVTDAYLAGLARHRGGRMVTFDRGLVATHPDVVDLVGGAPPAR